MSWLARSIANSLNLDEDDDHAVSRSPDNGAEQSEHTPREEEDQYGSATNSDNDEEDEANGRGVKEDLSELKDSLTRQFWGVASFLAPPPPPPPPPPLLGSRKLDSVSIESGPDRSGSENEGDESDRDSLRNEGEGLDREVEGYEGEGLDREVVGNEGNEEEELDGEGSEMGDYEAGGMVEEAVGITEEVLTFAMNIAHHPETWLDFPLEEEEFDEFDISDAQYEHALAVERLSPRLAALRIELCPVHMSEGYFWMVYFVLLFSRLNKQDADLLSTQQLMQARAIWMQELQKQTKEDQHWLSTSILQAKRSAESSPRDNSVTHSSEDSPHFRNISNTISPFESTAHHMPARYETVKHSYEIEFVDKSVIKEDPSPKFEEKQIDVGASTLRHDYYDDDDTDDDWLKEDEDLVVLSGNSVLVDEEDISFSDLEDDDIDCTLPVKTKTVFTEWTMTTKTL